MALTKFHGNPALKKFDYNPSNLLLRIFATYRYISFLNLDVVGGCLIFAWLGAQIACSPIPHYHYLLLGAAVWCVYTLDRLIDVRAQPHNLTARHAFWARNIRWGWFAIFSICLMAFGLLIFYCPKGLIVGGLFLVLFICIYLFFKRYCYLKTRIFVLKEPFIALGFALGITVAWWSENLTWTVPMIVFFLYLFLLAFINVIVIGFFEKDEDAAKNEKSLIHLFSEYAIYIIGFLMAFLSAGVIPFCNLPVFWMSVLAILPWLTLFPLFFQKLFASHHLYRYWVDGLLTTPLLFLFFR